MPEAHWSSSKSNLPESAKGRYQKPSSPPKINMKDLHSAKWEFLSQQMNNQSNEFYGKLTILY
jgi:hypothetical protein